VITVTDFRKIEDGILLLLDQEFGECRSEKAEDFLNGLRQYLKYRVKIEGISPVDEVIFEYPSMIAPTYKPNPKYPNKIPLPDELLRTPSVWANVTKPKGET
jgi:hypothetical protein